MNPLQIFPKHPSAPDTYYIGGGWSPACITAVEKRFSPGELAAEYWREARDFLTKCESASERLDRIHRWTVMHRFATLPHYDENPA